MAVKTHKCGWPPCDVQVLVAHKQKFCSEKCRKASKGIATSPTAPVLDVVEETGDTRTITRGVAEEVRSLADLVRVCSIDTDTWEIVKWRCGVWAENFQVRAELKKRVVALATQTEISDLVASAKSALSTAPVSVVSSRFSDFSGLMLEISIPDLHVGKLAWGKETGDADYDSKIARQVFEDALEALIQRMSHYQFDKVIFPIGNDLLNSDNAQGTTTAGTQQNTDSRIQKSFAQARVMVSAAIERLREIAPVHVPIVGGNHDQLLSWCLGHSLECLFHRHLDVTIDNLPRTRKYHQWGKCMELFTHGDKGKKVNYPLLMATEQPQMWSETRYREAHCGHLHKSSLDEFMGVKVRVSPALCPPDAWHAEQGYVRNLRQAEAMAWSKEEGLVGMAFYTVPE